MYVTAIHCRCDLLEDSVDHIPLTRNKQNECATSVLPNRPARLRATTLLIPIFYNRSLVGIANFHAVAANFYSVLLSQRSKNKRARARARRPFNYNRNVSISGIADRIFSVVDFSSSFSHASQFPIPSTVGKSVEKARQSRDAVYCSRARTPVRVPRNDRACIRYRHARVYTFPDCSGGSRRA